MLVTRHSRCLAIHRNLVERRLHRSDSGRRLRLGFSPQDVDGATGFGSLGGNPVDTLRCPDASKAPSPPRNNSCPMVLCSRQPLALHDLKRSDHLGGIHLVERIGPSIVAMESDMQAMPPAIPVPSADAELAVVATTAIAITARATFLDNFMTGSSFRLGAWQIVERAKN